MTISNKRFSDFYGDLPDPDALTEDVSKFTTAFREKWWSGRAMRFRDWVCEVEELLDRWIDRCSGVSGGVLLHQLGRV